MIEVKKIKPEETYSIRLNILRKGIDLPYKYKEDFDKDTFHLGAYSSKELLGVATFIRNGIDGFDDEQYQLRGMATLRKVRGKGFGKIIIDEARKILSKKNINTLWCNARKEAIPFYEKLNFNIIGEEFSVEKVGKHYRMQIKIGV